MITIIAIMGKTSSGKDTVARYIKEKYGIKPIVSFTDRKIREGETDGVEHWFVTKDKMGELINDRKSLLAWTEFKMTGIRYCASTGNLPDEGIFSYIINPDAVPQIKENRPDINLFTIYVNLSEDEIMKRAILRKDGKENVVKRLDSEREQFDACLENKNFDALLETNVPVEDVYEKVDGILKGFGII